MYKPPPSTWFKNQKATEYLCLESLFSVRSTPQNSYYSGCFLLGSYQSFFATQEHLRTSPTFMGHNLNLLWHLLVLPTDINYKIRKHSFSFINTPEGHLILFSTKIRKIREWKENVSSASFQIPPFTNLIDYFYLQNPHGMSVQHWKSLCMWKVSRKFGEVPEMHLFFDFLGLNINRRLMVSIGNKL